MVFLTSVDIVDTGFLTVTNRSGQLTPAARVNNGQALRLKGVELDIDVTSNLDDETFAGNADGAIEIPLVSVNPDKITLTILINRTSNEDNPGVWNTEDMKYLAAISRLPKTPGFKAIYYPVDSLLSSSIRRQNEQILFWLGRIDTVEDQGDLNLTLAVSNTATQSGKDLTRVRYIPVKFNSCKIKQETTQTMRITLEGYREG